MLALKYENFLRQYAWLVRRVHDVVDARAGRLGYRQHTVRGVVFHEDCARAAYSAVDAQGKDVRDEFEVEPYEWFAVNAAANLDSPVTESDLYEFYAFQMFLRWTAEGIATKRLAAVGDDNTYWQAHGFDFDDSGCQVHYHTRCFDGCESQDGQVEIDLTDLLSPLHD